MSFGAKGYALAAREGEGLWFFNGLFTVKAGGRDTQDAFTLIEAGLPAGQGPPPPLRWASQRPPCRCRNPPRSTSRSC